MAGRRRACALALLTLLGGLTIRGLPATLPPSGVYISEFLAK